MVGVVIAAHGALAEELLNTAVFIVGEMPGVKAISIDPSRPIEEIQKNIKSTIKKVDKGDGVLILTDMFGGTPANMTLSFLEEGKVEVITGINLPMLIKLSQSIRNNSSLEETTKAVVEHGKKSINQASAILKK